VGVLVRAYAYILSMGRGGLPQVAERAVLNANYLKARLAGLYPLASEALCKHEFVLSARPLKERFGVNALDIAKRLLDFGVHPPTVYFPLVVPEALMIEPTETESRETLDAFVEAMTRIRAEMEEDPEKLHQAPTRTPVRRIDEVRAAKQPVLRWKPEQQDQGGPQPAGELQSQARPRGGAEASHA
jgi:glycine dehydrogenase subunit 2